MKKQSEPSPISARRILACDVQDETIHQQLQHQGLPPTTLNAIYLAMSKKAAGGDVQAAKYLRDVLQEEVAEGKEENELFQNLTQFSDQTLRRLAAKWDDA